MKTYCDHELGFAGKYSMGGRGDLRTISLQTGEKIQRIRQTGPEMSPFWRLPGDGPPRIAGGDPWVKRLGIVAICCFVLMVGLLILYNVVLNSGVSSLQSIAGPIL